MSINIVDSALNVGDGSSEVTFTFSEAPVGFAAGDIVATGGTVSGLVATADPLVYTATFTADDGFAGTGSVSVGFWPLHGRGAQSRRSRIGYSSHRPGEPGRSGGHHRFFRRRRQQLDRNVHVQRGAGRVCRERHCGGRRHDGGLTATAYPPIYTATFSATDGFSGTGSISLPAGSYTDAAFNAGGLGTDTVAIDRANPTVTVDIVDGTLNQPDSSSTVTFTFSEMPIGFGTDTSSPYRAL